MYWICISSVIQRKGTLIYLKRYMGEQRKQSLIYAPINWEPGVKMTTLKRIFDSKRVAAGEPESGG